MLQRVWLFLDSLGLLALWAILAAFLALAFYQLHITLVYIGILLIEHPETRPVGWNTATLSGLSRFLILVLGGVWLVAVSLLERYLRQARQEHQLRNRIVRLVLIIGALCGVSYAVLLLLS